MFIQGHVENGLIVPHGSSPLPEGAEVMIVVPQMEGTAGGNHAAGSEFQTQRESLARLQSLPDENPGDRFSGADHDEALYGTP